MRPKPFLEIRMPSLEDAVAHFCEDNNLEFERRLGSSLINPTHLSGYFFFDKIETYEEVYKRFQNEIDNQWEGARCARAS